MVSRSRTFSVLAAATSFSQTQAACPLQLSKRPASAGFSRMIFLSLNKWASAGSNRREIERFTSIFSRSGYFALNREGGH